MSDHDLTRLIAPASSDCAGRGPCCPDEAQLAGYVGGTIACPERETVRLHLADCAYCRGQVGFLVRAERPGPEPAVPARLLEGARERSWWAGRLSPVAVAAAVVGMALALVMVASRERQQAVPGIGTGPGAAVATPFGTMPGRSLRTGPNNVGAPLIVRPAEGQIVARGALDLQWEEAPGALFYTVQVVDPRGDIVWEGRAEGTQLQVPSAAPLVPGQGYFAWVLAHLRSGATVRSAAVGFRVAPE